MQPYGLPYLTPWQCYLYQQQQQQFLLQQYALLQQQQQQQPTLHRPPRQQYIAGDYRIMTFNLMRDDAHEYHKSGKWSWSIRESQVLRVIVDANPDVLCLQEMRDLLPLHPARDFLEKLKVLGYDYSEHVDFNNVRLRVVTAWKREVFKLVHRRTLFLNSDNVESSVFYSANAKELHRSVRPLGCDTLISQKQRGPLLHVWNAHLGHSTAEKQWAVQMLPPKMLHYCGATACSVLCMDGNFFTQSGGLEQRAALCNNSAYPLHDLTANARLFTQPTTDLKINKGTSILGTWIGTSIDSYALSPLQLGDPLDIIAGYNVIATKSFIYNKSMHERGESPFLQQNDVFCSDHLPLIVTLKLLS